MEDYRHVRTICCPECKGNGSIPGSLKGRAARIKCSWCDGHGKLTAQVYGYYKNWQKKRVERRTETAQPAPSL